MTLRVVNGQTVTSEKVTRNASKTFAQMRRRVQWANLVNLFRSFEGTLHPSFENRPPLTSDFNLFMGANIGLVPVYLTHSEAKQGGCVVAGYQVTRGSLPSLATEVDGSGVINSGIELGSLAIGDETTLAAFSAAVVANNEAFAYGDQISVYVARQITNTVTGVPYVKVTASEVTLANDPETLLVDIVADPTGFGVVGGKLACNAAVNGAVAYVHSRKTPSGTKVSTQRFVVTNSLLATYQSQAALDAAVTSYGGALSQQFLTPNIDDVVAPD